MTAIAAAPSIAAESGAVFAPDLEPIAAKIRAGQRLCAEDGMTLFNTPDIWSVCRLADLVRRRMHGDVAYYNVNRHLNYSNICALSCTFCAFYRKKDEDGAYEHSVEEIAAEARRAADDGATEIHIVGGLHPWLSFSYYTDMLRAIQQAAPTLHIKAFTAVEIVHLARISGRGRQKGDGIASVLRDLKDAGLGSLPGGGAEVFDDRVHDEAFKGKIRSDQWLDVHRAAHELGLNSNATILYGHIESREDRIHHMMLLRREQDRALQDWAIEQGIIAHKSETPHDSETPHHSETPHDSETPHLRSEAPKMRMHDPNTAPEVILTGPDSVDRSQRLPRPDTLRSGYFQTIIPLPFFPDGSALEHLPGPSGLENLRMLAICRLMLDNIPHVKAFWIMQTLEMAQLMLQAGADDIDGTVVWYDITKVGGGDTHQEVSARELRRAIREAGFQPIERDTLYRPIERGAT